MPLASPLEPVERREHPLAFGLRHAGAGVHDLEHGAIALAADHRRAIGGAP